MCLEGQWKITFVASELQLQGLTKLSENLLD